MARITRQTRRNDSKIAGLYDLEERLGAGHFAEVKLARHVFTGERVAVKVIDKLKLDDTARDHLYQEVRCMKLVQHPNIVRLYEVIDTNTKLYLVQELGDGGDMYDYIMKHERGLSEEKARRYFRQILQAIDYCHKLFVVHRDLKPENVIFFKKFDVAKLTDFGFSNHFMPGKKLETACGSLAYSAPEILLGDSYDAPAVDVWSLGVILFMMVVGKAPFYEANESETLTMILDCKFHVPDHVSPACKSLISRMIVRDALKRASLENIMSDPWILQDDGPLLLTTVPLANQIKLGDDQHDEVVQKMQLGDIADKETIKKCLDAGSYNHVSATYYLLAEQVLRRLHWPKNVSSTSCAAQSNENKSHVSNRACEVASNTTTGETLRNNAKERPVSAEDLPSREPADLEEPELSDIETNLVTSRLTYHSTESIYDQLNKNNTAEQHDVEEMLGAVSVSMTKKQRKVFKKRRVVKVKSTPAFLNQISEERESDLDDSPRASPRVRRPSRRPLDVLKAQQKADRRPSPASSSGGRRSSSVSSSSEDDGDLDKKMRRLSTERCRRSPKRRSDDEGDGDDGEGGSRSPSGVARKKMMSDTSRSRGAEGANAETGKKSDVGGKCANAGLLCAVLQDKLVEVNLKLGEALNAKVDGKVNAARDSGRVGGTQDLTGNENAFTESSNTRLKYCSNENECLNRTSMDDDKVDEALVDGIMDDGIVKDGIMEVGIMEVELTKDRIKKDEITADGIMEGGIVKDEIIKYGIIEDAIVENGIMKDGIMKDGIMKDGVLDDGIIKDRILEDEIMEILEGRKCVDIDDSGGNENISDKENLNVSTNGETLVVCGEHDGTRHHVFRGSDIDEIEMYMKAKDSGVRTIFNNPKVSRITSNCCQII